MVDPRIRNLVLALLRYGVGYPLVATGGAAVVSRFIGVAFENVLFFVFAVAVVVTGFGAMGGSTSNDALQYGAGITGTSNPGQRWDAPLLVQLMLFVLGLAAVQGVYVLWWAG